MKGTVANQLFRRIFRNSDFFQTHLHLGTLTFEKNQNHKNFLEKVDLRQCLKILGIFLFFILASCVNGETVYMLPDTEISCPDGTKILIKYAKLEEVRLAILHHLEEKKKNETTENYTVIALPDRRSTKIDKKSPEEMLACTLRESQHFPVKRKYIYGDK